MARMTSCQEGRRKEGEEFPLRELRIERKMLVLFFIMNVDEKDCTIKSDRTWRIHSPTKSCTLTEP